MLRGWSRFFREKKRLDLPMHQAFFKLWLSISILLYHTDMLQYIPSPSTISCFLFSLLPQVCIRALPTAVWLIFSPHQHFISFFVWQVARRVLLKFSLTSLPIHTVTLMEWQHKVVPCSVLNAVIRTIIWNDNFQRTSKGVKCMLL